MAETSSRQDSAIGTLIDGRYRVLDTLGSGGMGVVYRAEHVPLHRPVALKVLQRELLGRQEVEKRFEREAQALAALAHPNIVTVLDYGWHEGAAYLVMEHLAGRSLFDLAAEGPLPPSRAIEIARQLLRGLAFAHARGIVHRDLKPGNIFLHEVSGLGETVKILDFGLAKFLEGDPSSGAGLTRAGAIFGTPAYMAPEQASGQGADLRTDVYAAGVVLYELLAGRKPFVGTADEMIRQHLAAEVPPLVSLRPDLVPVPALEALLKRALEKDPARRFRDASEMLEALESIPAPAATSTARSPGSESPTVASEPAPRRRSPGAPSRRFAVAGLVAVAVAAVLGLALLLSSEEPPSSSRSERPEEAPERPATPEPIGEPVPDDEAGAAPEGHRGASAGPLATELPPELAAVAGRIERGEVLGNADLRPIYGWFVRHPDDARALLLLGRAYADAGWNGDAVDRYRRAARLDATARQDPRMLGDLLAIVAADAQVSRRAAGAVRDIFGEGAIAEVDRLLPSAADDAARSRLARLRDELAGH